MHTRTRHAIGLLLLTTALVAAACGGRAERPHGLLLRVAFERDSVRVVSAWSLRTPPHPRELAAPRTDERNWRQAPVDRDEIVVALHARDGRVLRTIGRAAVPDAWFDAAPGDSLLGGLRSIPGEERVFHLPVPDGIAWVTFYRSELRVDPPGSVPSAGYERFLEDPAGPDGKRRTFGLRRLGSIAVPDAGGAPSSPPSPDALQPPLLLATSSPVWNSSGPSWLPLGGTLLGVTELHDADVPEPFLIAILGDGFTKEEDRQFLKFAHLIVSALRTTRPFSDNMAAIRVIAVRAASEESGITDCPHRGVPRNTFYGVRGYYPSPSRTPTGAGYVGMDNWEDLYLTADKAGVPVPDLFIMVANCAVYGGSGWPDRRMAFVCTGVIAYGPLVLGQAALHESGHAIADLADEYFGQCYAVWNEDWTGRFPNVVPASHAETASWYTPAIDVHAWDATGCSFPGCNGEHNEPGSAYTGIGLYYGGHFVESQPAVVPCDEWARGGEFHRSESECRMRYVDAPFCAVCAGEIEAVLLDTVGTPPQAP